MSRDVLVVLVVLVLVVLVVEGGKRLRLRAVATVAGRVVVGRRGDYCQGGHDGDES